MVSVIIPNYNHASYLAQRIDSVLNQTYQNFEVIILDDCSLDNSQKLISLYQSHPKVAQIIFNETNSGSLFKQWEKGLKFAKGEYIWIAESDDYAHPEFLESLVPLIEKNENIGFVYSNTVVINQKEEDSIITYADIRNDILKTNKWSSSYERIGLQEIEENLLQYCTVNNASAVLFNKNALVKVNPFDIDFRYVGDWYCYLKISNYYSIKYLNKPLNFYRMHDENASKGLEINYQFIIEHFKLFDWVFRNINTVNLLKKKQIFNIYTKHHLFSSLNFCKVKLYKKLFLLNPSLFYLMIKENLKYQVKRKIPIFQA